MLLTNNVRIENAGGRVKRINGRINTELSNLPGKNNGAVQMGKGGGRRRVGQVVRRHVDALYRSNGSLGGRGDAFLQSTEVGGQGRLITNGRRYTAEQR